MSKRRPTVLVADDEPAIVDGHAARLEGGYAVRRAYSGREALDRVDEFVDVALLDRRMPEVDGDEVLDTIRRRGYGCRVAMLTGVDPDFDVVELGFDEYLRKPIEEETLLDAVERLCTRKAYDEELQQLFSLASRAAALESEYDRGTLDDRQEYRHLTRRIDELRDKLDDRIHELPPEERYTVTVAPGQAPS